MREKKIIKNYVFHLIYQIVAVVVLLVSMPYVSRILGPDNVGIYSYTAANTSYFSLIAVLGLHWYGEREVAFSQNDIARRSRVFFQIMILKVILFLLACLGYFLYVKLSSNNITIRLLQGLTLLSVIFDVSWLYRGMENFRSVAICNSAMKLLSLLALFLFVKSENDLAIYIIIQGLSLIVGNIILWVYLPKMISIRYLKGVSLLRDIRVLAEMSIPGIAVQIYNVLDKTMLGVLKQNMTENGYYEQVGKLVTILITMICSLCSVLAPNVAGAYSSGDTDYIKNMAYRAYRIVLFLASAACFGAIAVADQFIPLFLGAEFTDASSLMTVYAFVLLIIPLSNVAGNIILTPIKRHNKGTLAVVLGALTNICLNLILIPRFSAMGAVVSTLVAEIVVTVVHLYYSRDYISIRNTLLDDLKYIVCGLGMLLVLCLLRYHFLDAISLNVIFKLAIEIALGAGVYLGLSFMLTKGTMIKELKSLIKKEI